MNIETRDVEYIDSFNNNNNKEFSKRHFQIHKNLSMTHLEITERHHNYPLKRMESRNQENGSKQADH